MSARNFPENKPTSGQEIINKYNIISMGGRPHYRCPWCNSSDKERLVWLFLLKRKLISGEKKISVLHVAPEKNTRKRILSRQNIEYISGDMFSGDERYNPTRYEGAVYLDITDMSQFPENRFDLIICNHVLEHVPEDRQAMKEIGRVLRPGGYAILQVPVSRTIWNSIEDISLNTDNQRLLSFGQSDHVRIYAEHDYVKRLEGVGLNVEIVSPEAFLNKDEIVSTGINKDEKIYILKKDGK